MQNEVHLCSDVPWYPWYIPRNYLSRTKTIIQSEARVLENMPTFLPSTDAVTPDQCPTTKTLTFYVMYICMYAMQKSTFFLENLRRPDLYLPRINHEVIPVFQQMHFNIQPHEKSPFVPIAHLRRCTCFDCGSSLRKSHNSPISIFNTFHIFKQN